MLSNFLRKVIIGLVSLLGILLLADMAAWVYYWVYGLLNPAKVSPLEDWYLGLGLLSFPLQIGSVVMTLTLCLLIRSRWVPHKLGRAGIWLFSGIGLSQLLLGIQVSYPAQIYVGLIWGLLTISPLAVACFWVSRYRAVRR